MEEDEKKKRGRRRESRRRERRKRRNFENQTCKELSRLAAKGMGFRGSRNGFGIGMGFETSSDISQQVNQQDFSCKMGTVTTHSTQFLPL